MNFIVDERPRFKCPVCQNMFDMAYRECPQCGEGIGGEVPEGEHKKYRTRFGMNGGCRKEEYDVLLTEKEYNYAKRLTELDLYQYIVNDMWDRVTDAYIDAGTEYEGLCGEIKEV